MPQPRTADLPLAQAFCADAFIFVAATNIQVHGGIGFTWSTRRPPGGAPPRRGKVHHLLGRTCRNTERLPGD